MFSGNSVLLNIWFNLVGFNVEIIMGHSVMETWFIGTGVISEVTVIHFFYIFVIHFGQLSQPNMRSLNYCIIEEIV